MGLALNEIWAYSHVPGLLADHRFVLVADFVHVGNLPVAQSRPGFLLCFAAGHHRASSCFLSLDRFFELKKRHHQNIVIACGRCAETLAYTTAFALVSECQLQSLAALDLSILDCLEIIDYNKIFRKLRLE